MVSDRPAEVRIRSMAKWRARRRWTAGGGSKVNYSAAARSVQRHLQIIPLDGLHPVKVQEFLDQMFA